MADVHSTVRVATWNLWWRFGEWQVRQRAIRDELRSLHADVIALQEVWGTAEGDSAQLIAEDLGYERVFEASPRSDRWQQRIGDASVTFGNAVVSRWPIRDSRVLPLPALDAPDEGRFALLCEIETPHGTLPFVSTHLNAGWGQSTIRAAQLSCIGGELVQHHEGALPPVLCGDFNAGDDFDEIRALAGKRDLLMPGLDMIDAWWATRPGEPGYTWDRENPLVSGAQRLSCRVDYVFVGYPGSSLQGMPVAADRFATSPRDGTWPSDHYGVFADLSYGSFPESPR